MIVSTLLQPCYNLLHATLLHSGWWALDRSFKLAAIDSTVSSINAKLHLKIIQH